MLRTENQQSLKKEKTHLSLDDVEDADVTMIVSPVFWCGDHDILTLQQPSHHIQNGCLADVTDLVIQGQRRVTLMGDSYSYQPIKKLNLFFKSKTISCVLQIVKTYLS